jgi:hypothetical protein
MWRPPARSNRLEGFPDWAEKSTSHTPTVLSERYLSPKAPKGYDPGYEFTKRKTEKDAHEAAEPNRAEFITRMSELSTLLNDAEYFAAFRVIQADNLETDDKRPTKEAIDHATETMKGIEKQKGLNGLLSE